MCCEKECDMINRTEKKKDAEENGGSAMERIVKENYYLDIAETVLERSTCLRRQYGAIIVRNDEIVATGYNGAPRGRKNCSDLGYCVREQMRVPRRERYELYFRPRGAPLYPVATISSLRTMIAPYCLRRHVERSSTVSAMSR